MQNAMLLQPHYHLSLSRTVPVRYHHIEPLVAELRACLAKTARWDCQGSDPLFLLIDHPICSPPCSSTQHATAWLHGLMGIG